MKILKEHLYLTCILILASFVPLACTPKDSVSTPASTEAPSKTAVKKVVSFELESPAYNDGKALPSRFTCGKDGVSPPLTLSDLPENTKTVAFILEDPDADNETYTHWIMWNWPAAETDVPDAIPALAEVESGATQGTGSNGKIGYNPPCPPSGTHRYYLKAYALDSTLDLPSSSDKQTLLAAMQGHIIGQGMLMGTYHK